MRNRMTNRYAEPAPDYEPDDEGKRLWLIDGAYLFSTQSSVGQGYNFDYLLLKTKLEQMVGPLWRAYYLNALQPDSDRNDGMQRFHSWLQSAPPSGPKIITKLYNLRDSDASHAYCHGCTTTVQLECLEPTCSSGVFPLTRRSQKGVDVGLATLALTHLDSYDTLMLSSGDGDLLDAVKFVSDAGKKVELAVFRAGVATELQSWADRIYWIDEFAHEIAR